MSELRRFRPTRAGIVNLYEYVDQVFAFSGGRLLLRGHNTSGKTKALELLLPFVLDGSIAPQRLDPFAQSAKEMKWNVVGCVDDDQRIGYVWLEFERIDDDGEVERFTAGIGLRAHRDRPDVRRWHFVVHSRRIGDDLLLVRDRRDPLTRGDLIAAIGGDGDVFDRQIDYRARLRETILRQVATEEQHQTMLRLMRELRRPHLSKTLEPDGVAEMLSAGLPEVDDALMRRLAGGLEQLESLESRLRRLRSVRDKVRLFHQRTYRAYLRAELRERSAGLRLADSEVGRESEALRRVTSDHQIALAEQQRLATVFTEATVDVERWEGAERALLESAAWSAVTEVEALRERAEAQDRTAATLFERHEDETVAATALEAELVLGREATERAHESARGDLGRLNAEASRAGLEGRARTLDEQLLAGGLTPLSWSELVAELAAGRAALLDEHRRLLGAARAELEALDHARERERVDGELAASAASASRDAAAELDARRARLNTDIDAWVAQLVELNPDAEAIAMGRTLGRDGRSARPALDGCAEDARRALADDRARVELEVGRLEDERADLDARRASLEAKRDEPPEVPTWRDADRAQRLGAPLWSLVEFVAGVAGSERASIEAALGAAGLLDAWITPEGEPLPDGTRDVALTALPAVDGPSLSDVLEPVDDGRVPRSVVARVLSGIALDGRAAAIGRDGRFALGPLHGAAAKAAAEHVGASARAARRARLLEQLAGARAQMDARLDGLAGARASLVNRGRRLDNELRALPSSQAVADGRHEAELAALRARAAADAHDAARTAVAHREDAELAARAAAREHAVAHELGPGLDESAVAARREACVRVEAGVGGVRQRFERVAAGRADVEQRTAQLEERHARLANLEVRVRDERTEARRLKAEHAARDEALGVEEREIRERHQHAQQALRTARVARDAAATAERETAIRAGRLEGDAQTAQRALTSARDRRTAAHGRLVSFAGAGLLPLVLLEDTPEDHADASSWTMTRALELARGLPDAVTSISTPSSRQAENVMRALAELDRELSQADMGAHGAPADDGLLLVQVTDGAAPRPFAAAVNELDAEIDERERVLSAEERRVFGDAIVEELAEHLRVRMHDVRDRVERMNAVLRRAPTAGGKIVQLEWRAVEDDELRAAIAGLRRSASHFDEDMRRTIVEFFRLRVEQARRAATSGDGVPEPMARTLAAAFDYRRWHRFDLLLEAEGRRERLTKRSHAVGSGGEQSALIHLPLFAAAAALYGDGHGPRLVMLDEALSGIDDDTRERVLAATVAFDLDLVMTSHELWGTYVSVPSLAIYQLYRQNGVYGVHAIPFIWDGAQLREDEQGELFVA